MNVIDSSAWLEFVAGTSVGGRFAKVIEKTQDLIVPSITIYEVFKKVLIERGEDLALTIIAHMRLGKVIDLDADLALRAAELSAQRKLPMADSIVLATAQAHRATLWTLDRDFKGMDGVRYFAK